MLLSHRQKEAFDRIHEANKEPDSIRLAKAEWQVLSAAIIEALRSHDMTVGMDIGQLRALFATLQPGQNCNGWVNPYPKDDPRSLLKQYQFASFHDTARFILEIWSRQVGKDFTAAGVAARSAFADECDWTIAAPSERQSLESLEKAKIWVEAFQDVICDFNVQRDTPKALMKAAMITLPNKRRIRAVPGMPHTVRGLTSSVIITEADFLEKPEDTMVALMGSIANEEGGKKGIRLITTPNGKDSYAHKIWRDPDTIYSKRMTNIWQAVCLGLRQSPDELYKGLSDPERWAQDFLCEWQDALTCLLPYELITKCEDDSLASMTCTTQDLSTRRLQRIAGIDFGRVSDPTVMVMAERSLGTSVVRHIEPIRNTSTPDQVRQLMPHLRMCDRICVDYTGPGIGFGDLLVKELGEYDPERHLFGKVELCTFTLPFKREIFPALRLAFERQSIKIPSDPWLREDLHVMAQVISNGQYNYKAPRTDAGHSDGCTALALMHRAALQCGGGTSAQSITASSSARYSPSVERMSMRMGRSRGM